MTIEKHWITEAGLEAVVIMTDIGHMCGYVGVPEGHPLYGCGYDQPSNHLAAPSDDESIGKRGALSLLTMTEERMTSPELVFDVHGSLTFSGNGDGKYPLESSLWWFGYDCAHSGDRPSDEYLNQLRDKYPNNPLMWGRLGEYRDLDYNIAECESLAKQIVEKTK